MVSHLLVLNLVLHLFAQSSGFVVPNCTVAWYSHCWNCWCCKQLLFIRLQTLEWDFMFFFKAFWLWQMNKTPVILQLKQCYLSLWWAKINIYPSVHILICHILPNTKALSWQIGAIIVELATCMQSSDPWVGGKDCKCRIFLQCAYIQLKNFPFRFPQVLVYHSDRLLLILSINSGFVLVHFFFFFFAPSFFTHQSTWNVKDHTDRKMLDVVLLFLLLSPIP